VALAPASASVLAQQREPSKQQRGQPATPQPRRTIRKAAGNTTAARPKRRDCAGDQRDVSFDRLQQSPIGHGGATRRCRSNRPATARPPLPRWSSPVAGQVVSPARGPDYAHRARPPSCWPDRRDYISAIRLANGSSSTITSSSRLPISLRDSGSTSRREPTCHRRRPSWRAASNRSIRIRRTPASRRGR